MRKLAALLLLGLLTTTVFAAESTESLLKKASAEAKAQNKNVLVKFSASWCGWCHRLDDFLNKTEAGKLVKDQFVVVTIIVLESADHKSDENPGGAELLAKLGGAESGIPYFATMTPAGKTILTSNPNKDKPGNIGFPVEDFEIAHFMTILKKSTKLDEKHLAKVEAGLKENAKKIKGGG